MTVRILLVEDQNPYLYEELLGAINGFEFHVVKRGDQALDEFRTYRPDLVLMDVRLPLLDGISAVRQIRRVDLKTPVIVITAYDTPDTKQRALAAGATDFFGKPFSYIRLHQRIKELALPEVVIPDGAHARQLITKRRSGSVWTIWRSITAPGKQQWATSASLTSNRTSWPKKLTNWSRPVMPAATRAANAASRPSGTNPTVSSTWTAPAAWTRLSAVFMRA